MSLCRALLVVVLVATVLGASPPAARARTPDPVHRATHVVTKLLVVIEENHSYGQMKRNMPYAFKLAKRYGYATRYRAVEHPSLPNYLAIASGRTHGIEDNQVPAVYRLPGHTVFGLALRRGKTARAYLQAMPERCHLHANYPYAVRHNPWAYFVKERGKCRRHNRAMPAFNKDVDAGKLPRVGMLIPDAEHDAHDGSLRKADRWFKTRMKRIFAGPDWQKGRLVVVLTADEDDGEHNNRVLTTVIHQSQRRNVVDTRLNHYSLSRLYSEVAGIPRLRKAKKAPSMAQAFGLPVR